ncbi:MAG: relaxase MobL [Acidobacteria bacterium]|nr:relaxase MobL [Acidobacteriota bacterium]
MLNRIRGSKVEGTSEATRYIARSDLDREREGKDLRKLFSDDRDELSHYEADRWLTAGGARPEKRDIIHYVLSLQEPNDFERLGANDKDRKSSLRETVRRVMRTAEKEMRVERLHWAAGIHLNTDNPHVHIVISRCALDRDTEKLRRFGKLPHRIAPHNERQPDGTKSFVHGALLDVFAGQIETRQLEHARQIEAEKERTKDAHAAHERTQTHERTPDEDALQPPRHLPGAAVIARGEVERLTAPVTGQRSQEPLEEREQMAEMATLQRGKEVYQTHVLSR